MTPTPKVHYEHEEIARRFTAWAELPTHNEKAILARNDAWNTYCDARDGLPAGTSYARSRFSRLSHTEENEQLGMFN